jgi:hypothetical protein
MMHVERWERHGIVLGSIDHAEEYFIDLEGVPKGADLSGLDIFTYWTRNWVKQQASDDTIMKRNILAVLRLPSSYDRWYESLDKRVRHAIRTSRTSVEQCTIDEGTKAIASIYTDIEERQGQPFPFHNIDAAELERIMVRRKESVFFHGLADGRLVGAARIIPSISEGFAILASLISRGSDFDKKPNDRLLAGLVEWAIQKQIGLLVYDYLADDSLGFFKRRHGFCPLSVPRFGVPLTARGSLALRFFRRWLQ